MPTFEQGFNDTENAAASAVRAANGLSSLAKQLQKAAQDGNIGNMKRSVERLANAVSLIRQEVDNAVNAWPFDPEGEERYLSESYVEELKEAATRRNLRIHERDGRLISHPSVVRILPADRAVRIDRRKVSTIRPSKLADILFANQQKRQKFRPETFLEALYRVYLVLIGDDRSGRLIGNREVGPVIPLLKVHEVFTSLPQSSREYDRTDFARDVYSLEASDVRQTRAGARVSFPVSRQAAFSFVGPDGETINYYGIQFSGGSG